MRLHTSRTLRRRAAPSPVEGLEPRLLMVVSPAGPEFTLNASPGTHHTSPVVDMDAAGNAEVVWFDRSSYWTGMMVAQRFDRNGARVGDERSLVPATGKEN